MPAIRRSRDLRLTNAAEVVRVVRDSGRRSRAELAKHTTLSHQALATILTELVDEGVLLEIEERGAQRGPGRPALLYEYNPHRERVVSLFIGLRYAEISLCDGFGRPMDQNIEFYPGWDVDEIVAQSGAHIDQLLDKHNVNPRTCVLGIVVHGYVDAEAGTVTNANMGWSNAAIASKFHQRTKLAVTIHEAARVAAKAEYQEGAAQGVKRATVLSLGPEYIATTLVNGEPDVGADGQAGMIGLCKIDDGPDALTISEMVGSFASKRRYTELSGVHVDWMADVYDHLRAGDPHAQRVIEIQNRAVAFASAWLITILNPQVFVVGHALVADERNQAALLAQIIDNLDPTVAKSCSIRMSLLGPRAWTRGGVHAALEHHRSYELKPASVAK
ncbi:MAG: ROK family protein [Acidimicrobiia bacterium]